MFSDEENSSESERSSFVSEGYNTLKTSRLAENTEIFMENLLDTLIAKAKSAIIPEEYDFFGKLVGSWDFDFYDRKNSQTVAGEWHFAWVLEGAAIQDVFILPSRPVRAEGRSPYEEYGTTLRVYNPSTTAWDIVYCCEGEVTQFEARREENKIVLTALQDENTKWVFAEITDDTFHWQNVTVKKDGTWNVTVDIYATRKDG